MNIVRLAMCGGGLALSLFAVGCGEDKSEGGLRGSADLDAARAKLNGEPTGDLTKDNAASVERGLRKDTAAGTTGLSLSPGGGGGSGSGGSSVGTKSLRVLTTSLRPLAGSSKLDSCPDIDADKDTGTCACDEGQVSYEIPNLKALKSSAAASSDAAIDSVDSSGERSAPPIDITLQFDKCKTNGKLVDGLLAMQMSKASAPSSSTSKSKTPAAATSASRDMLIVMNLSIDSEKTSLAFAIKNGEFWYSQDVDANNQYVLVKLGGYSQGDGEYTVLAKNGEFDCSVKDGKGKCTSDKGESISVAATTTTGGSSTTSDNTNSKDEDPPADEDPPNDE